MRKSTAILVNSLLILQGTILFSLAGQNSSAGIRFDLNSSTSGNQNQVSMGCPGINNYIRLDIYVVGASNLDTYEFNIAYNPDDLQFMGGSEDQPVTYEFNFLKTNGGSTVGFTCTAAGGMVNCANTLIGDQGDNSPDGEGLLASIVFRALVECPDALSFAEVDWYDNDGIKDVCTDKGQDASLPVELTAFNLSLSSEGVLIEWTTASEVNNSGFNILRSLVDSTGYEQINMDLIKGQGNSSTEHNYTFTDEAILAELTYYYKLEQIDLSGFKTFYGPVSVFITTDIIEKFRIPDYFDLAQNYPNPFNPVTTIRYQLPQNTRVNLSVINVRGQKVITLVEDEQPARFYSVYWNGKDAAGNAVPSGVYYYRLTTDTGFTKVKKMVLIR